MGSRNNYPAQIDPGAIQIWNDAYVKIREDFGYSEYMDRISSILLNRLFIALKFDQLDVSKFMARKCVVLGPLASSSKVSVGKDDVVIVAGNALESLKPDERVDFVVTDLDGDYDKLANFSKNGGIVVVHAHGDNIDKIVKLFPTLKGNVIISCQTESLDMITDFGGFTDGDRAVFFAHFLRSPFIRVVGFDFENPIAKSNSDPMIKKKKLKWAKHLIDQLKNLRMKEFGTSNITVLP